MTVTMRTMVITMEAMRAMIRASTVMIQWFGLPLPQPVLTIEWTWTPSPGRRQLKSKSTNPTIAAGLAAPEGQDTSSTTIAQEQREVATAAPTSETVVEPRNESLETASPQPALGVPVSSSGMKSEEEGEVMSAKSTSPRPAPPPSSQQEQQKQPAPVATPTDAANESLGDARRPVSETVVPVAPVPQSATDDHSPPNQPLPHEQTTDLTGPNEGPRTAAEGSVLEDGEIEDST
ncbi:hypothetical protein BCR43DRAFT_246213 [Syncephalastrum racemosum]|uniref:Uncharacterized protein n=1 Tax=Syncephalastrum racemosum TaxID=13706 RepID=A0A1X2HF93_SYNRA|nr:hypothetical protein BCR43DRAFT_246213 [Syncephalastrum racemosum]